MAGTVRARMRRGGLDFLEDFDIPEGKGELYEGVYYSRDPEGDEQGLNDFLQGVTLIS